MLRAGKKQRIVFFLVVALAGVFLVAWELYEDYPAWFPAWFDTLLSILSKMAMIIGALGSLAELLSFALDRSPTNAEPDLRLTTDTPICRIDYNALIARLGPKSGRIPWIDRRVSHSGLFRKYGRIAIVGPMKSGKSREAAELIRLALADGTVAQVYEPTSVLNLISLDALSAAVTKEVDDRQPTLFFVDELGLRPEAERLQRLSTCLDAICRLRRDTCFLITIQSERLEHMIESWLSQHRFHKVELKQLSIPQRKELARNGARLLGVAVTEDVVKTLANETDGRPYSIVFALQQAQDCGWLDMASLQKQLSRSLKDAWALQRRLVIQAEPTAESLLESIFTFKLAGVTLLENSIRHYACFLMNADPMADSTQQLLDVAAEQWARFDIAAAGGLYTIPDPLWLLQAEEVESQETDTPLETHACNQLQDFARLYHPGRWSSLAVKLFGSPEQTLQRRSVLLSLETTAVFRLASKLWTVTRVAPRSWDLDWRLLQWMRAVFLWPLDRALLLLELVGKPHEREALLSRAYRERAERAFKLGDDEAALKYLDRALDLNPSSLEVLHVYANNVLFSMDLYKTTVHRMDTVLESLDQSDPARHMACEIKGVALTRQGSYEEAIEALLEAKEVDPDCSSLFLNLGHAHRLMGCYEQAKADYHTAIELGLDMLGLSIAHAEMCLMLGELSTTLELLNQILEKDPEWDRALAIRGLVHELQGDAESAQADLIEAGHLAQETYEKFPWMKSNILDLALYRLIAGEMEEAQHLLGEALSRNVSDYLVRETIGDLDELLHLRPDCQAARAMQDLLQKHLQDVEQ